MDYYKYNNNSNFNNYSSSKWNKYGAVEILILINLIMFIPFVFFQYIRIPVLKDIYILQATFLNLNVAKGYQGLAFINNGAIWQLVTSTFLHGGGIMHIFFNMYALYIFGKPIEQKWGTRDFLIFYLFCGIFANVLSIPIFMMSQGVISLSGASGAVYGVLLAYGTYYPDSRLLLFFVVPIRAKWAILILAVLALFFEISGSFGRIAHLTHLFGFVAAFLYIFLIKKINPIKKMFFPDKDDYIIY